MGKIKRLAIVLAVIICLLVAIRLVGIATNTLLWLRIPTSGNSPTLKLGDLIWASRLKTLQHGNFIAFKQYDSIQAGIAVWVKRCVGMPGDTVEMKNGVLIVNGKNVDETYTLTNEYVIFTRHPQKFMDSLQVTQTSESNFQQTDSFLQTMLSTAQYKRAQSMVTAGQDSIKQLVYPYDASNQLPFFVELKKTTWTMDNFGPLRVPFDHYFVLGDNRHSSMDSRFVGFIKKENYVATVIGK